MEGQTVLAIEHDWRMRKLIRANLEALGVEVQEAVNGQHGLQLLRESQPNLILLDLDLPDVLRSICREVPAKEFREDVSSTALRRSGQA